MCEIIGNVVDIDTRRNALAILETCVERMRLWEAPYDVDSHFVRDIDEMICQEEQEGQEDDLDSQIYIMAKCVQRVTDIIDRIEHGEED